MDFDIIGIPYLKNMYLTCSFVPPFLQIFSTGFAFNPGTAVLSM